MKSGTTLSYRNSLMAARPEAEGYVRSLEGLPDTIRCMSGTIDAPVIYPIKSLGGVSLAKAAIGPTGLQSPDGLLRNHMAMLTRRSKGHHKGSAFDRERFSLRQEPLLALVRMAYDERAQTVTLTAPDFEPLALNAHNLRCSGRETGVSVKMHDKDGVMLGLVEDRLITPWVRTFLRKTGQKPYTIEDIDVVLAPPRFSCSVQPSMAGRDDASMLYSDEAQVLVASSATLAWMNADLRERSNGFEASMGAFRPNIVLNHLPANVEDVVTRFSIGSGNNPVQLLCGDLCTRCSAVCVDPSTGTKTGAEPIRWLINRRPPRLAEPATCTFGVYASFRREDEGKVITGGCGFSVMEEKP